MLHGIQTIHEKFSFILAHENTARRIGECSLEALKQRDIILVL